MERAHLSGTGYLLTYLALIALATTSLLLSFLHWPSGDLLVSLVIAAVKAFLVLWFFMHLVEQQFANQLVVVVTALLFALLIGLTASDVATRKTFSVGPRPNTEETDYVR